MIIEIPCTKVKEISVHISINKFLQATWSVFCLCVQIHLCCNVFWFWFEGCLPILQDWEIIVASEKLAECQETIVNLGKQLKALVAPKDASTKIN